MIENTVFKVRFFLSKTLINLIWRWFQGAVRKLVKIQLFVLSWSACRGRYNCPCTILWVGYHLVLGILALFSYHTWYFHSLMTSAFWRQNILRHFTWSAPPLLYSWSHSPIGCSAPLYSRSSSLIWSAYYFLYISFSFRFNEALTNLTSLRQHHLQYTITLHINRSALYSCNQF